MGVGLGGHGRGFVRAASAGNHLSWEKAEKVTMLAFFEQTLSRQDNFLEVLHIG